MCTITMVGPGLGVVGGNDIKNKKLGEYIVFHVCRCADVNT